MVFSSVLFLFLFLPVSLALYWIAPARWRNAFLLAISLVFYAWGEGVYVLVMLASIAANYGFGLAIARRSDSGRSTQPLVSLAVVANLGMLGVFKYLNFIVDNLNLVLVDLGVSPIELASIHLPIGISFFTFQAMSYVIEVHRGQIPAQKRLMDLALYISLFPQLIAGPIVRYKDVAAQLAHRVVNTENLSEGIRRFGYGLGKKVLLANPLGMVADSIFAVPPESLSATAAWVGILCYTLQIYFDFSGYSDMAIGLGRMFGFRFLENFNYPYIAQSIQEFWRRWHISLSTWFRDFLYIPLGGNRNGLYRTWFNLLVVFVLCGLWHGASWNFLIWGLLHGLFLMIERAGFSRLLDRLWRPLRHGYVLLAVIISWVFFRAEDLDLAMGYLGAMAFQNGSEVYDLGVFIDSEKVAVFFTAIALAMPVVPKLLARFGQPVNPDSVAIASIQSEVVVHPVVNRPVVRLLENLLVLCLVALCSIQLAAGTYNPFIYFRF